MMEEVIDALICQAGWYKKIDNGITLQYLKKFREGDYTYCYAVTIRDGIIKPSAVVSKHYCCLDPLHYKFSEKELLLFEMKRAYQVIKLLKRREKYGRIK